MEAGGENVVQPTVHNPGESIKRTCLYLLSLVMRRSWQPCEVNSLEQGGHQPDLSRLKSGWEVVRGGRFFFFFFFGWC